MASQFNLVRLFRDVVNPQKGEVITFLVDHPHGSITSTPAWDDRRKMAEEWRDGITGLCAEVGAILNPMVSYPATGANNADLPKEGIADGKTVALEDILSKTHICFALTNWSCTAPLNAMTQTYLQLRAASLPGVARRMEQTALSADYTQVARTARILAERLDKAESALAVFSTGHQLTFDLRYRNAHADDGYLHADKTGFRLINLPSGEAFIVPYEGEREGEPSRTSGQIPVPLEGEIAVLNVKANRIVGVEGTGPAAQELMERLMADRARQNIAELGLGCNPNAVVWGSVLEDEKAGFHWAYGRSEHLGGVVGPAQFAKPENIIHQDIVYAKGCPVTVTTLTLKYPNGAEEQIIKDGEYTVPV
jgi:leucyl aminopeptidase (aminopeptidase T)